MGHGSRDAEALAEFRELERAVQVAAPFDCVTSGWLEFAGPGVPAIQEAIASCVALGERTVLAIPVLLHHAGHSRADMPREIAIARARFPDLDLRTVDYLGMPDGLLEIAEARLREAERSLGPAPGTTTALLVGRGSSDAEANAEFFKLGRLLWERLGDVEVECCFVSLARPDVSTGIERCVRLGARRIVVVPYFLNTGVLVKRIQSQAESAASRFPDIEIAMGEHLGIHPRLVEVILNRARALVQRDDAVPIASGVG
jgi:sirohydrochlorin cobaltochelatase